MKPQGFWALSTLLGLVLFAAAGCQRAPSPTVTSPTATLQPAQPQKVQPSDDTSPLPQPKSGEPAASTSPLPAPTPTPGPSAEGAVPVPAEAAQAVQAAQADLVERLGVDKGAIQVLSVEPVEWPDASLGCPQPGMAYAQVITPGFRALLEVGGHRYEYHTDTGKAVILCADQPTSHQAPTGQEGLPIFVSVMRTFLPSGSSQGTPLADLPPNSVFAYVAASRTLLLRPLIEISPETQVLVGQVANVGGSNHAQFMGELFQFPLEETGPITIAAIDGGSAILTLAYGDQTFELSPGQSRSFKRTGDQTSTEITVITHYGRLAAVEPFPYSPDAR